MKIRSTQPYEIDILIDIYEKAKSFMQKTGNKSQWINGYPSRDIIMNDIKSGNSYVCINDKNEIVGAFYFILDNDITYSTIYEGKWLNDKPYGVIHRIASNGKQKGIASICLEWCFKQCNNIRIDTHHDNIAMQNILIKNGFIKCGVIYVADGTPRLAFQKYIKND